MAGLRSWVRGLGWSALVLVVVGVTACDAGGSKAPPTGTPTDPVEVCTSVAQVCRYKGQQLGVCQFRDGDAPAATRFVCVSQH